MRTQPQEVFEIKGHDGSLDGFVTTCACGLEMRNAFLSELQLDAARHLEWHRTNTTVLVYR